MIEGIEETRLIGADKNSSKAKILRDLREVHPEWLRLKLLRAKTPNNFISFQEKK